MRRDAPDPARRSRLAALACAGLAPAAALTLVILPASSDRALVIGLVAGLAALVFGVAAVPLTLVELGRYRRAVPPSRGRTAWTAVVTALLLATAAMGLRLLYLGLG